MLLFSGLFDSLNWFQYVDLGIVINFFFFFFKQIL